MNPFRDFEHPIREPDVTESKLETELPDDIRPEVYKDGLPDDVRPDADVDELPNDVRSDVYEDELPDDVRPDSGEDELPDDVRPDSGEDELPDDVRPDLGEDERPDDDVDDTNDSEPDNKTQMEVRSPIQNKMDGLAREHEVEKELKEKYPENEGYTIISEAYLRDKNGNIVKDPATGEARRIDFVIVKDGTVVDSVEVTSKTADKTEQSAKEERIRENGGNYVRDENGNLVEIPSDVTTRIERRD